MRKLIVGMHISMDGFVAGADGIPGYSSSDDAVLPWIVDSLDDDDTIVLGRSLRVGVCLLADRDGCAGQPDEQPGSHLGTRWT